MADLLLAQALRDLVARARPDGGFGGAPGRPARPDATAWAILALRTAGAAPELVRQGQRHLAANQGRDGRVSVDATHADAWWPTPLAVLAWHGAPESRDATARAVKFLLATSGQHWQKKPDEPSAHDTAIRGWSWVSNTHSWVEPTSLALLALDAAGAGGHTRAEEATRMLLDRQLPSGGWNYGNTVVFGQELRPMPECTGMALDALAGRVPRWRLQASIEYLQRRLDRARAPLALGWGLLGLGAWGARPPQAAHMVAESLSRQERLGAYDTALLGLLAAAAAARGGLRSLLERSAP